MKTHRSDKAPSPQGLPQNAALAIHAAEFQSALAEKETERRKTVKQRYCPIFTIFAGTKI